MLVSPKVFFTFDYYVKMVALAIVKLTLLVSVLIAFVSLL